MLSHGFLLQLSNSFVREGLQSSGPDAFFCRDGQRIFYDLVLKSELMAASNPLIQLIVMAAVVVLNESILDCHSLCLADVKADVAAPKKVYSMSVRGYAVDVCVIET